jgi:large subunit ribosomal protein L13
MEYRIDAKNKPLGRLASEVAVILQGKKDPRYNPREVGRDSVVVMNVLGIVVTGKKHKEKKYYHHTGYIGHLKTKTFEQLFTKDPKNVVREAVRRMLPKNFLNQRRLLKLRFEDGT